MKRPPLLSRDGFFRERALTCVAIVLLFGTAAASANLAGGGTGKGPDVSVHDNGDDTVTMTNGIVSITIAKRIGALDSAVYVHSNGGTPAVAVVSSASDDHSRMATAPIQVARFIVG